MSSWRNTERTRLYAEQAVPALDDETRELLRLLLTCNGRYSKKRLLRWCERPSLGSVLRELERSEEG